MGVVSALVFVALVGGPVRATGGSMLPSVVDGEVLWGWRWPVVVGRLPSRGQVVVFDSPLGQGALLKRVVGVPGDRVEVSGGVVRVNGSVFPDGAVRSFWAARDCLEVSGVGDQAAASGLGVVRDARMVTVPGGSLFVMGDNRSVGGSEDSRLFGVVPVSSVRGVVGGVVWPPVRPSVELVSCELMVSRPEEPLAGWRAGSWVVGARRLGVLPVGGGAGDLVGVPVEVRGVVPGFLPVWSVGW